MYKFDTILKLILKFILNVIPQDEQLDIDLSDTVTSEN